MNRCKNCYYWLRTPDMEEKKINKEWAYCYTDVFGIFIADLDYNEIEQARLLFNQDFGCRYWKKK